jgi:hypothetical protein
MCFTTYHHHQYHHYYYHHPHAHEPQDADQLIKIFKTMGTPTLEEWPTMKDLPEYKEAFPVYPGVSLPKVSLSAHIPVTYNTASVTSNTISVTCNIASVTSNTIFVTYNNHIRY